MPSTSSIMLMWQAANLAKIEHPHQQLLATPGSVLAPQFHHSSQMKLIKKDNKGKSVALLDTSLNSIKVDLTEMEFFSLAPASG